MASHPQLVLAGAAPCQMRRAKSERKVPTGTEVPLAEVLGPAAMREHWPWWPTTWLDRAFRPSGAGDAQSTQPSLVADA